MALTWFWINLQHTLAELWYTFEPIKVGQEIKYTFDVFWYIGIWYLFTPFHTHFIQFRYDFLSSIIIWYTFECIEVYLIHFWVYRSVFDTLLSVSKCIYYTFECIKLDLIHFWVYQNCIKSESKQGVQFWLTQKCIKVQQQYSFLKS